MHATENVCQHINVNVNVHHACHIHVCMSVCLCVFVCTVCVCLCVQHLQRASSDTQIKALLNKFLHFRYAGINSREISALGHLTIKGTIVSILTIYA